MLSRGTRLGTYDITGHLGSGGMGDVYQAHDTRLDRDVAIKVLPEPFAHDTERVARFEREARLLAALNHPNIAAIYGLEQSGDTRYLVMELVPGETLLDRIAREGRIPVEESLAIARQIAEALAAAHELGIIHRDLKPANVKVKGDGVVKVLDFGLAKAMEPAGATSPGLSQSPTITTPALMTGAGVILGTAAYMSPEQARGKPVDKRSDIWAFGAVLFEMLTGQRAFPGEDLTDTLAAVVKLDPKWDAVGADVPPRARQVLRVCLQKDPRQRAQAIGDVRLALEGAFETTAVSQPSAAGLVAQPPGWRRVAAPTAAAFVVGTVATALTWVATRPPDPTPPRVIRTTIVTTGQAAMTTGGAAGDTRTLAVTPDGVGVIYVGNIGTQLFVRPLDQLEPTTLATGAPRTVFTSPDGQWVGYSGTDSSLRKVAITGGPPVALLTTDGPLRGATWAPDDAIIFATAAPATGLQRVSAVGGKPEVLTTPDAAKGEGDHFWPEVLPDNRGVLFTITALGGGLDAAQVAVLDFMAGTHKILLRGGSDARYVSSGHLVYTAGGNLLSVGFDLDRLAVTSAPVPVLQGVATTPSGAAQFAVAEDGTLVYVPGGVGGVVPRSLVWVDRQGREEPIPVPARGYVYLRVSPDGTRVALDIRDQQNDIWIWDFARQTLGRLTLDPAVDRNPVWTPDGRRVVFSSGRAGGYNLFWRAADGTGTDERLTEGQYPQFASAFSPDGARIVLWENAATRDMLVLTLNQERPVQPPSQGGGEPGQSSMSEARPLIQTPFIEENGEISPDGRWLAYDANDSGQYEIYVRPFPEVNSGRSQVSGAGGTKPLWARNGQELFYVSPSGALMSVPVERAPTWSAGTPTKVFEGRYFFGDAGNSGRTYDVSPDGQRFLMIKDLAGAEVVPTNLVVVQHWFEELKRLVPTGNQ